MSSEKVSNIVQTAKHLCVNAGVRFTEKRQKVLELLIDSPKPLSAYELMAQFSKAYQEDIQATSMYRILDFLKEGHLVHKLNLINKFVVCSHIRCCQEHGMSQFLICTECGLVEEIKIPTSLLDALTERVNASGFSMVSPHLEMACVCHNCESTLSTN